jgi:hypothetical protein
VAFSDDCSSPELDIERIAGEYLPPNTGWPRAISENFEATSSPQKLEQDFSNIAADKREVTHCNVTEHRPSKRSTTRIDHEISVKINRPELAVADNAVSNNVTENPQMDCPPNTSNPRLVFKQPPLGLSITLPDLLAAHAQNNPTYPVFRYLDLDGVVKTISRSISWSELVPSQHHLDRGSDRQGTSDCSLHGWLKDRARGWTSSAVAV